jgi:hypothetical protein
MKRPGSFASSGRPAAIAAAVVFLALAGCTGLESQREQSAQSTLDLTSHVPEDLDDAIRWLKTNLPDDTLKFIRDGDESNMASLHFGLGLGIRNGWGLWSDSRLARWFQGIGISHPDDMSGIILDSLWRDLHGEPRRLEEQVAHYQAYWERARAVDAKEEQEDVLREERRRAARLGWNWFASESAEAELPLRREGMDVWGLYPFDEGFLVVFKDYRRSYNPVWHDGIHFLASADAELSPVEVTACAKIHDVLVRDGAAHWLCRQANSTARGWRIVTTRPDGVIAKRDFELPAEHAWLRLGSGLTGLLLIAPDRVYRDLRGAWVVAFVASSRTREAPAFDSDANDRADDYLPQRSATPIEHGGFLYFQIEDNGNSVDLYRLDLSRPDADLEDAYDFLGYRYVGKWVFRVSDVVRDPSGDLWIANDNLGSIYRIGGDGRLGLAAIVHTAQIEGPLKDITPKEDWRTRIPVGAILLADDSMYLAGNDGIVNVRDSAIRSVVRFVYPPGMEQTPFTSRPQYDYHVRPQRLGMFKDGSFVIGDSYDGIYVLKKSGDTYLFRILTPVDAAR